MEHIPIRQAVGVNTNNDTESTIVFRKRSSLSKVTIRGITHYALILLNTLEALRLVFSFVPYKKTYARLGRQDIRTLQVQYTLWIF